MCGRSVLYFLKHVFCFFFDVMEINIWVNFLKSGDFVFVKFVYFWKFVILHCLVNIKLSFYELFLLFELNTYFVVAFPGVGGHGFPICDFNFLLRDFKQRFIQNFASFIIVDGQLIFFLLKQIFSAVVPLLEKGFSIFYVFHIDGQGIHKLLFSIFIGLGTAIGWI